MKYLACTLFASLLAAQQDLPKPPPNTAPIISMDTHTKSTLVIDAKARATDYVQAFDLLRKDKPTLRILLKTTETIFSGIADLSATAGGTLLIAKVPSSQGFKLSIIPIEHITELTYSP